MGKLAVFKYFSFIMLVITFLMAVFTFFGLYGGSSYPAGNMAQAMLVYALPLLIMGNIVLLLYWLVRCRWHWAIIPLFTLVCCLGFIGTYYQIGGGDPEDEAKAGLKVATYNVASFNRETTGFISQDILTEMKKEKVDVLCLQEYNEYSGDKNNTASYKEYFPHMIMGINTRYAIFSRYPIKEHDKIEFPASNNGAMWADIDVNGKMVRVYNVHLETAGAHHVMGHAAKMEEEGYDVSGNRLLEAVYGSYTRGVVKRAGQANLLAQEIQKCDIPVIVAGDFVDVPYSYVYNTLTGGRLVDGFKECGSGLMQTLRGSRVSKSFMRIDYVLHDKSLDCASYYKKELSYSDHYPIFSKVVLN